MATEERKLMASLRKKYQQEGSRDEPPVSSPPEVTAAELPPLAADAGKPPEMPASEAPVEVAARNALKARLAEMQNAEAITREAVQQQPQYASEPQQPRQPEIPAAVAKFLAEYPRYTDPNDAIAQAEIYTATLKCNRDGKSWDQPDFIPTLERHLGIAPAGNGQPQPQPQPQPRPQPQQRNAEAPRSRVSAASVSAPPTREAPSMTTGRPVGRLPPLTEEEINLARSLGITADEYQRQKERMNAMKAAGVIQDGR